MRTRLTLKDLNGEVYGPLILMLSSMQIMYQVENEWLTECMIIAHNVKKHKLDRDQLFERGHDEYSCSEHMECPPNQLKALLSVAQLCGVWDQNLIHLTFQHQLKQTLQTCALLKRRSLLLYIQYQNCSRVISCKDRSELGFLLSGYRRRHAHISDS